MGLITAVAGAVSGTLADSWKEYFVCDALDNDVLMRKGAHKVGKHSTNYKGSENVITKDSVFVVADGQCLLIVQSGKIVEVCAEPGAFTWEDGEPSLMASSGSLKEKIKQTFAQIGGRLTFGGQAAQDTRVYYVNTKPIIDNKFGTASPVPFRVVDKNIGLDVDVSVRCSGVYAFQITDPLLFYKNVGNISGEYRMEDIASQLKTEFVSALQPALAQLSDMEIRPSSIPAHVTELTDAMNSALTDKWSDMRGLTVVSVAMNPITLPEEDQELIKNLQAAAVNRDPNMAAAQLTAAQAQAMRDAANNSAGAATGFYGMNMAMNSANTADLYNMGAQNQKAQAPADGWTCPKCGTQATGKFCPECGTAKPVPVAGWTCPKCGTENSGKFCSNCGEAKPADPVKWICPDCGTENTGKFCSNCGKAKE